MNTELNKVVDKKDLDEALLVYSDLMRFGFCSAYINYKEECIKVLEYFEEYEKCSDISKVMENNPEGLLKNLKKKK